MGVNQGSSESAKPLEQVKAQITPELAKQKAVAMMMQKAKRVRASIPAGADLSVAAAQSGDSSLRPVVASMGPAESVNGIPSSDYAVNNKAFSMKPGETSDAFPGVEAAYIVKLINLQPVNPSMFESQKSALRKTLLNEKQQRFFAAWIQNLKDNANIVDYRQHH